MSQIRDGFLEEVTLLQLQTEASCLQLAEYLGHVLNVRLQVLGVDDNTI